jgi:hypothetical protein
LPRLPLIRPLAENWLEHLKMDPLSLISPLSLVLFALTHFFAGPVQALSDFGHTYLRVIAVLVLADLAWLGLIL